METENTSIISHISIGTNDLDRAVIFYDTVLSILVASRL